MPIYEFRCERCGRVQSFLMSITDKSTPVCKFCGAKELKRLISKVIVRLSEETRLEKLADPSRWGDIDENDPRSIGKLLDRMGTLSGVDEFDEVKEEIEKAADEELSSESSCDSSNNDL